jgi:hypothetical protein
MSRCIGAVVHAGRDCLVSELPLRARTSYAWRSLMHAGAYSNSTFHYSLSICLPLYNRFVSHLVLHSLSLAVDALTLTSMASSDGYVPPYAEDYHSDESQLEIDLAKLRRVC